MIMILAVLITTCTVCFSQKGPLKGSGKTVTQKFEQKDFDKINLLYLDGKMEVEVGKPFSVSATIDDNLTQLLEATVENGTLTVKLKGNLYNKLYIEETNIKIKIDLPAVSEIEHHSNGELIVNGITGNYFRIKNTGNGSAYISGTIDELDIVCRDNGSEHAKKITAKKVDVKRSGNGNVYTNQKQ